MMYNEYNIKNSINKENHLRKFEFTNVSNNVIIRRHLQECRFLFSYTRLKDFNSENEFIMISCYIFQMM